MGVCQKAIVDGVGNVQHNRRCIVERMKEVWADGGRMEGEGKGGKGIKANGEGRNITRVRLRGEDTRADPPPTTIIRRRRSHKRHPARPRPGS